ncbi:hypothetical protein AHAS_Ahas14G0180400 [Arachis hypogaea]
MICLLAHLLGLTTMANHCYLVSLFFHAKKRIPLFGYLIVGYDVWGASRLLAY